MRSTMRTWVSVHGLAAPRIVTAFVVVAGLVAAGLGASPAYARRAQVAQDRIPEEAFEAEAVRPDRQAGGGVAAGAPVMIRPPFPPPALTRAQLMAALTNARPDLEGCLPAAGGRWRATVRASISARRGLAVRVTVTPREVAVSRCLDTAARRWLVPLEGRNVVGTVSATIRVGRTGPTPPPPGPLPPPSPPSNSFDERQVHDALDRQRNELLRCLPAASTTTPGDIVLRTSVRPDGTIVLEGATLPSGIGGGPALGCLAGVVGRVRVPSPPASRPVTHVITLGR